MKVFAEWNKWGGCYPDNSLYLPFMRNAVGPMDYTPGAMISMQLKSIEQTARMQLVSELVLINLLFMSYSKVGFKCWLIIQLYTIAILIVQIL